MGTLDQTLAEALPTSHFLTMVTISVVCKLVIFRVQIPQKNIKITKNPKYYRRRNSLKVQKMLFLHFYCWSGTKRLLNYSCESLKRANGCLLSSALDLTPSKCSHVVTCHLPLQRLSLASINKTSTQKHSSRRPIIEYYSQLDLISVLNTIHKICTE